MGNPPPTVNLMFEAGNVIITGNTTWFPFTAEMQAGKFEGKNVTVVAGFPGVTNTIAGTINAENLEATVTLGTLGELPGGLPIAWDLRITPPSTEWPWTPIMGLNSGIKPRVRVNGFRTEVRVEAGDPVSVNLSLGVDGETAPAGWFLAQRAGKGVFYSYTLSSDWVPGLVPAVQAPLRDVENMPIFSKMDGFPPGEYSLYFGVDTNMNGALDADVMSYDAVKLIVEPPAN